MFFAMVLGLLFVVLAPLLFVYNGQVQPSVYRTVNEICQDREAT